MAYFDNNSTTCPSLEVTKAVTHALDESWANPSSPHRLGARVRAKIEKIRDEMARSLGVSAKQLTFNSGSTESNNTILSWVARNLSSKSSNILISQVEHPSVLESSNYYFPSKVHLIPVDRNGVIELSGFQKLLDQYQPVLVCLLAAHNETGVIQPWQEVAQICKQRDIWFHCDATQWLGKMSLDGLHHCESFSFSAHKFGGPKGVGALVSSSQVHLIQGGGQEKESRGGTENFPGIQGMYTAWERNCISTPSRQNHLQWKTNFENSILNDLPGSMIVGNEVPRLWNTSLLCLPDFDNLSWVSRIDKLGHQVSTGSACSTARDQPSTLAGAIGLDESQSRRLVRVSSYIENTEQDWLGLADSFRLAHQQLLEERGSTDVISL